MKILLDLLPVVVFFATFGLANRAPPHIVHAWAALLPGSGLAASGMDVAPLLLATACAMVATLIQVSWLMLRRATVAPSIWISALLLVVLGVLTIWLRNEWFIKWKPTLLYWTFAAVLVGGRWIWKRNLLGVLFSNELQLPQFAWDRLLVAWAGFFIVLGGLNLAVAYQFSTETWVNFKTFGLLGLTFGYSLVTGFYVARYLKAPTNG
ncbi:MAG TPA: septation protein A [Burkholderiaceae bacterium]|nr:septation protein A [Burkholderiaceae bacterium]